MNRKIEAFDVVHLFPEMRSELLSILKDLDAEKWSKDTACDGWSVKDVAGHILADDMGYLSRHRDKQGITFVTDSFEELVGLINQQNDIWVQAMRRLSVPMLLSQLEFTGNQLHEYLKSINPHEGTHPVSWAGNQEAPMSLQIARELTEYWMHHQHICEGLGINSLKNRRFLHPVLSTFVHALPRTYADIDASNGTVIQLQITGEASDSWYLLRENDSWSLYADIDDTADSVVTMSDDTAWRLFTKGISQAEAKDKSTVTGDIKLGEVMLNTVAILA